MVINSTSAVEASIQAVSPELILSAPINTGSVGAAGAAAAGAAVAALASAAGAVAADAAALAGASSAQATDIADAKRVNRQTQINCSSCLFIGKESPSLLMF
jgi:hypothetical protein